MGGRGYGPSFNKPEKFPKLAKRSRPGLRTRSEEAIWKWLIVLSVAFSLIWMLCGCRKAPPRNPLPEDQLLLPAKIGCRCEGLDLNNWVLIGNRKFERAKKWLRQCAEAGYISKPETLGDVDPLAAGVVCPKTALRYFRLIGAADLSRVQRDLLSCRSQLLIQELE
jgi:hypothetical protein